MNVSGTSCDVGEYLDYENCKCRKRLVDKSVEECKSCTNHQTCKYCKTYAAVSSLFLTTSIGIDTFFVYLNQYKKNKVITKPDETTTY